MRKLDIFDDISQDAERPTQSPLGAQPGPARPDGDDSTLGLTGLTGETNFGSEIIGESSVVQSLPAESAAPNKYSSLLRTAGLLVVILLGGYAAFEYSDLSFDELLAMLMGSEDEFGDVADELGPIDDGNTDLANVPEFAGEGGEPTPDTAVPEPEAALQGTETTTSEQSMANAEPTTAEAKPIQDNPYWDLPNRIVGDLPPVNRGWTALEEESFRSGLVSQFTYQRYRTVLDVIAQRLRGSEAILWDALKEPKLWTRLRAAAGLADFGVDLTLEIIEKALAQERPSLLKRYFKRFRLQATPGELLVMRHAIKLTDAKTRVIILRALLNNPDDLLPRYFEAARSDTAPIVQRWIQRNQPRFDQLQLQPPQTPELPSAIVEEQQDPDLIDALQQDLNLAPPVEEVEEPVAEEAQPGPGAQVEFVEGEGQSQEIDEFFNEQDNIEVEFFSDDEPIE